METIRQIIDINVMGVIIGTRAAIPLLRKTKNSLSISTSSSVATYGHAMRAVYTASKFAVKGLTEALSLEFERFGVRTADVLPGCIDTPMLRNALAARTGKPFDESLFESMPKEGAYRLIPVSAIAEAVWNAYHSDVIHWYVPEEVGDIDRLKGTDFNAAREETRAFLFGEFSFTNRETNTDHDMERLIVRYDFSDRLKVSAGKYHTSMGYWNASFHHGAWLQTSIDRPRMMRFGSPLVPIHFEGLLAEGTVHSGDVNLGYRAGAGTGLHNNIDIYGNTGDIDGENAVTLQLYARPGKIRGLEFGFSYLRDEIEFSDWESQPVNSVDEDIYGLHAALDRDTVEILAEYLYWDHSQRGNAASPSTGYGFYLQAAHRLGGKLTAFKPYARLDKISADSDDVLFAKDQSWEGLTLGMRYDFHDSIALKLEYRNEKQGNASRVNSVVAQVSFVLIDLIRVD